jgi:hypothetical protein
MFKILNKYGTQITWFIFGFLSLLMLTILFGGYVGPS